MIKLQYEFLTHLQSLPFIEKIILFGSRARLDNRAKSDIDIAILCTNASDDDWLTVLNIIEESDTLLKVDCVRLDALAENSDLRKNINLDGVILYAKNSA